MTLDDLEPEHCHVCGKEAAGERLFCRFYLEERREAFCSPHCAERHLRATAVGSARWVLATFDGGKLSDSERP